MDLLGVRDSVNLPGSEADAGSSETGAVPRYAVGPLIAHGGMGAVYEARDTAIRRQVAMKTLLEKLAGNRESIMRFVHEAQVTGQLEHPNIVPVHELGLGENGVLHYTMKRIRGQTLAAVLKQIREGRPEALDAFPLPRLLTLFLRACDAVAFAHSRGVIHRDLKPENVMVGDFGEVLVVDWGIAKVLPTDQDGGVAVEAGLEPAGADPSSPPSSGTADNADGPAPTPPTADSRIESVRDDDPDTRGTMVGQVMGTPAFMAPEQALGRIDELDARTDVYALGGILYNLLALRPPVSGRSARAVLLKVSRGQLDPLPGAEKATRAGGKSLPDGATEPGAAEPLPHLPGQRVPQSLAAVVAKALALDPGDRYQSAPELQRDVEAYLHGFATEAEQAGLIKQFALLVKRHKGIFAAAGIAACVLLAMAALFVAGLNRERRNALRERDRAVAAEAAEARQRTQAETARDEAETARGEAEVARDEARRALRAAERENYYNTIGLASHEVASGRFSEVQRRLWETPVEQRGWEWGYLMLRCQEDLMAMTLTRYWINRVAWAPDGRHFYAAHGSHTERFEADTGRKDKSFDSGAGETPDIAVSRDGTRLLTASLAAKTAYLWDVTTGKQLKTFKGHTAAVWGVALSPDARRVATASEDRTVKIWDAATGSVVRTLSGHTNHVRAVTFTPDGARLLSAGLDNTARLWDAATGSQLLSVKGHVNGVYAVACAPSGRRFLTTGGDWQAKLWDAATGRELRVLRGHANFVVSAHFHPRGRYAATASFDHTIRIWDTESGKPLGTLQGHRSRVNWARYSPDGTRILSCGHDGAVRLWDPQRPVERLGLPAGGTLRTALFTPDGKRVLTAGWWPGPVIADARTGQTLGALEGHEGYATAAAISADGRLALTGGHDKTARVWNLATRECLRTLAGHAAAVHAVAFTPSATHAVTASEDRTARVWDVKTGACVTTFRKHRGAVRCCAVSADGSRVASAGPKGDVRIWDPATGEEQAVWETGTNVEGAVIFSPDNRFLVAGVGSTVRFRDCAAGETTMTLSGHSDQVMALSFSPDGRRLASASQDGAAKVWDARHGRLLLTVSGPHTNLQAAAFAPDGRGLVVGGFGRGPLLLSSLPESITPDGLAQWRKDRYARWLAEDH